MTKEEAIDKLQDLWNEVYNEDSDGYIYAEALDMAIEALSANCTTEKPNDEVEQKNDVVAEPTDLISRADVLALAEKGYIISNSNYKKVCDLINELPSADRPSGEWKLASEELPQSVGSYIVTCKYENGTVYVDYDFWTVFDKFKYNGSKVTAWIPFPKPYEGGENE